MDRILDLTQAVTVDADRALIDGDSWYFADYLDVDRLLFFALHPVDDENPEDWREEFWMLCEHLGENVTLTTIKEFLGCCTPEERETVMTAFDFRVTEASLAL